MNEYKSDDRTTIWLFVSLSTGNRNMVSNMGRIERILKANKVPFVPIDVATDQKAMQLWRRRANGRLLPGVIKDGDIVGVCWSIHSIREADRGMAMIDANIDTFVLLLEF